MIYLASDQTLSTFILYIMIVRLMRPFTIQEDTFSYLSRQIPPFSAGSLHFIGKPKVLLSFL